MATRQVYSRKMAAYARFVIDKASAGMIWCECLVCLYRVNLSHLVVGTKVKFGSGDITGKSSIELFY
jgi:hypothetical protein